jgi:hypothetical protein
MNLYIQIENGQPINHPASEDNLIYALGSVPSNWEPFVRVEMPTPTIYQVLDSMEPTYEKVNGVWTDVWALRDMTETEKTAKQITVKAAWTARPNASNFTAWTFSEVNCRYEPPIPYPLDDKSYFWQGTTNTWVETPPYPTDGKQYKLDIPTATWVLVS